MFWNKITRRHLIQGSGGIALALPVLKSLEPKEAYANASDQKSLVCFFKPNGCYPEHYFPHEASLSQAPFPVTNLGDGIKEFQLADARAKLSPIFDSSMSEVYDRMNLYLGLSTKEQNHNGAIPFATSNAWPSIDQLVAKSKLFNKINKPAIAIQATKAGYSGNETARDIVDGKIIRVAALKDALVVFEILFSQTGRQSNNFRQIVQEQKALDLVLKDANSLLARKQLGSSDKIILESYLEFIRDKEKQLAAALKQDPSALRPTTIPSKPEGQVNEKPLALLETMIELMSAAIKTNQYSCFNFQLASSVDETRFALNQDGYVNGSFHNEISHSTGRKQDHLAVDRYLFSQVAKFYESLNQPISAGEEARYADNLLVYVSGDMGAGEVPSNHTSHNAIAVSLSGKNIPIKTGRGLSYSQNSKSEGYPHNQLLIGLMEAAGARDWRQILKDNRRFSPGFGDYGGNQRIISDNEKQSAIPYMFS